MNGIAAEKLVVPNVGFELTTYCLQDSCSTTELIRLIYKLTTKVDVAIRKECELFSHRNKNQPKSLK